MKLILKKLASGGLYLSGPNDQLPEGFMRRFRGVSALSTNSIITRDGSDLIHSLNAHSLRYFASSWYSGVSTAFYWGSDSLKTGLLGNRLSFSSMPPTAGVTDYLFVAGGGSLFKAGTSGVLDGTELITNGDMELDANWSDYGTPATNSRSSAQAYADTYSRLFTPDAVNEGIQGATFTVVAGAWYQCICYVYPDDGTDIRIRVRNGANDDWSYNTLHESLTQDAWNEITFYYAEPVAKGGSGAYIVFESDDSTSGNYYVDEVSLQRAYFATNWGIAPPSLNPAVSDSGSAASNLGSGDYAYRLTYKNSVTGTRSNPNPEDLTNLLLHFDNNVTDTTGTHTPVNNNACTFDASNKVFGTHAIDMNGTNQYVSVPSHLDWYIGRNLFTCHLWVWFDSATTYQSLFFYLGDSNNYVNFFTGNSFLGQTKVALKISYGFIAQDTINGYATLSTSQFYHFAVTIDSQYDVRIFVDGTQIAEEHLDASWPDLSSLDGTLQIGHTITGYSDIKVDEFVWIKGAALWTEDFTPPTAATSYQASVTVSGNSIDLDAIPQPDDEQADIIEVWRTIVDGAAFFKLVDLATGTTSYTDDIADDNLQSLELPTDNLKPYSWFDDCYGPWNGSMFWITRTQSGERGRVYYSPIGRAEAVQGFIEVTSDDDGLQRILSYAGNLFVISKSKAYQIYGTNSYFSREIPGVPGTNSPHTVIVTPIGPMWESQDGVRVFTGGAQAELIAYDAVRPVFRGRTVENIASFTGVVATFARGEYIVSDGTNTLAINVESRRWRDLGVGCNALAYAPSTDQIAATISNTILDFEKEGETDDNSAAISLDILAPHMNLVPPAAIELIRVDANSGTGTIAAAAYYDDSSSALGNLSTTNGRRYTEFSIGARLVNRLGLRLSGSLTVAAEIHAIEIEYWPMVLVMTLDGNPIEVPGRLSGDRQTLTFEAFSDTQASLQQTYIFERLFYDLNSGSENVVVTLTLINETPIALGTLNNATRTIAEINIAKKGRFQKLALAGDFTTAIALRRLELTAKTGRAGK